VEDYNAFRWSIGMFEIQLPMEGYEGVVTANGLVDRLIRRVKDQLSVIDIMPSKEVVLAAASKAFDDYVAPFDIPLVPNFMEPYIDAHLKSVFMGTVDRLYDAITVKRAVA
jgi:hypothetical protein